MEECQTDRTTSLVLADPDAVVRQGLVAFCAGHPDLAIAGECSDGVTLLKMIETVRPDFVLLELSLPGVAGMQVLHRLRAMGSPTRAIVLTTQRDGKTVLEALYAGVDGYLLKDGPGRHLLDAIKYIRKNGGVYLSPLIRDAMLSALHSEGEKKRPETGGKPGGGNGPGEDDGSGGMAAVVGLPIGRPPRPRQRSS